MQASYGTATEKQMDSIPNGFIPAKPMDLRAFAPAPAIFSLLQIKAYAPECFEPAHTVDTLVSTSNTIVTRDSRKHTFKTCVDIRLLFLTKHKTTDDSRESEHCLAGT